MAIVYRDELNEYYNLTDKQMKEAYKKFIIQNKVAVENLMDENYLFDAKGNSYNEREM